MFSKKTQSRIDFFCYLYRVDPAHRKNVNWAALGLILSLVGVWLIAAGPVRFNLSEIVGAGLAILSAMTAVIAVFKTYERLGSFDAPGKHEEYYLKTQDSLTLGDASVKLTELMPGETTMHQRFRSVVPPGSTEAGHTGERLNDWLSEQPAIMYALPHGKKNAFTARLTRDSHLINRLTFLRTLVRTKHATNEQKYRLADISPESRTVSLEKVGYYDALMTNQLVSDVLKLRPENTRQDGRTAFDLRHLFPIVKTYDENGSERFHLSELADNLLLANSVGVTTLALSADGFPLVFYQNTTNIEGHGKITVAGSGSADFADINAAPGDGFLDVIKYGAVRELSEEARLKNKSANSGSLRRDAAQNTLITGFFRWVRRAGKPEFLAVTLLGAKLSELEADNVEVSPLMTDSQLRMTRMTDFQHLAETLTQTHKAQMPLSSAMAIWRLAQISKAATPADAKLRTQIAAMLNLQDA